MPFFHTPGEGLCGSAAQRGLHTTHSPARALWECTPARALHKKKIHNPARALWKRCTPARALHPCTPARALHAPSMKLAMDGSVWVALLATRILATGNGPAVAGHA